MKKETDRHHDTDEGVRDLVAQLVDAEAAIQDFLGDQIDAVLDPLRSTPILLRQAQKALVEEVRLRQLAAILQSVQNCIVVTDPAGTITYWNEGAATLFGYSADEAMGRSLAFVYPDEGQQALTNDLNRILSGEDIKGEREARCKDGRLVWVDMRMTQKRGAEETAAGFILVANNITEKKKATDLLKKSQAELKDLSRRLLSAQEDERKRIAMELHDSVASSLSTVKIQLENSLNKLPELRENKPIQSTITLIETLNDEIRRIMTDLRPSLLDNLGLRAALNAHSRLFEEYNSNIDIILDFAVEEEDIPEHLKIVVFRIVQEALHNIEKYSRANQAKITIEREGRALEVRIYDNGVGFDLEKADNHSQPQQGMGLINMKDRAQLSGGALRVHSKHGDGTTIRALWRIDSFREE